MVGEEDDTGPEDLPPDPELPNAAEPTSIKRQRKERQRVEDRTTETWKIILSDARGREVMWRLLNDAHTFDERFACGPNGFPQPEATWFHAGEQAFGQRLYRTLGRIDRAAVLLMHDENDPAFAKPKPSRRTD